MRHGRAVGRVALAPLDERVPVELLAHRGTDCARAAAVHDPDGREPGERRVVDEGAHGLPRLLGAVPAHVELVADISAPCGDHAHRGSRSRRACGRPRAQPSQRDPQSVARGPDHLGLVSFDGGDRALDPECRRLDGVAGRERARQLQRRVECADSLVRLAARSDAAPSRRSRSGAAAGCPARLAVAAACDPDLLAERLQLGTRRGEVALRLGRGPLALGRR